MFFHHNNLYHIIVISLGNLYACIDYTKNKFITLKIKQLTFNKGNIVFFRYFNIISIRNNMVR